MKQPNYRDLAEFGLPLVTPEAPDDLGTAAVLLNQSGNAVVVLAFIWRYTTADGKTRTSRYSNMGSSMQLDVLCGRAKVVEDLSSFILPGSKRLITERGMFGNNLDVLPPDFIGPQGGGGGGSGGFQEPLNDPTAEIELSLDIAIFEDGLCVGPDKSGLFESLTNDLERQRSAAREIVMALRRGVPEGEIFEMLRPLARRTPSPRGFGANFKTPSPLLSMFAKAAINRLVDTDVPELLAWFEPIAESTPGRLHRPS